MKLREAAKQGDIGFSEFDETDMKGKKCLRKSCRGKYGETGIQDDMHGELHCLKCGHGITSSMTKSQIAKAKKAAN